MRNLTILASVFGLVFNAQLAWGQATVFFPEPAPAPSNSFNLMAQPPSTLTTTSLGLGVPTITHPVTSATSAASTTAAKEGDKAGGGSATAAIEVTKTAESREAKYKASSPVPLNRGGIAIGQCARSFQTVVKCWNTHDTAMVKVQNDGQESLRRINGNPEDKSSKMGLIATFRESRRASAAAAASIAAARTCVAEIQRSCMQTCDPARMNGAKVNDVRLAREEIEKKIRATEEPKIARMAPEIQDDAKYELEQHIKVKVQEAEAQVEARYNNEGIPEMNSLFKQCQADKEQITASLDSGFSGAASMASSATAGAKSLLTNIGIGAAVVGGGLMYKNHRDDKKEEDKVEAIKNAYENGIMTNAATGEQTNCLTEATYIRTECRTVLFNYCGKPENASKSGCTTFANYYCSAADASQGYCVSKTATTYCRTAGTMTAQSPACEWLAVRPTSCETTPERIECLAAHTPAYMDQKCANFPNDPLCIAYKAGKVVLQPSGSTYTTASGATATTTATTTTATTAAATTAATTTTGSTTSASTTTVAAANTNNWAAGSSAWQQMCATGQIVNCNN